jgi:hypothetical protein
LSGLAASRKIRGHRSSRFYWYQAGDHEPALVNARACLFAYLQGVSPVLYPKVSAFTIVNDVGNFRGKLMSATKDWYETGVQVPVFVSSWQMRAWTARMQLEPFGSFMQVTLLLAGQLGIEAGGMICRAIAFDGRERYSIRMFL